jgi:hypothetical protein
VELVAKLAASIVDTGGKFTAGVVDTADNFATGGKFHTGRTLTCEFSKKFKMTLMLFSGAWGKVIHGKNLKQKVS